MRIIKKLGDYIAQKAYEFLYDKDVNLHLKSIVNTEITNSKTYLVYSGLLTQNGTSAPTVTVLENTLGLSDTDFIYNSVGSYSLISPLLVNGKTMIFGGYVSGELSIVFFDPQVDGTMIVNSGILETSGSDIVFTPSNGMIIKVPFEIRVYN